MAGWNNTVPQGVIGTGNAQVFENPVAGQFGAQLQNLRRQELVQAQQLAKNWREAQLEASSGRLWAPEMADIEKSFIDRGIQLKQKGIDPYGSSKEAMEYQRDKRYVEAQQGFRKLSEERFNEGVKMINANPNKYDRKSIQEFNDFFTNTKLSDAFERNIAPPQLSERFDLNEALKGVKAIIREDKKLDKTKGVTIEERIVDEPATQNAIIGTLVKDPRGANFVKELTSGFAVPEVRQFSPTYAENVKMVSDYIKGDPQERRRLATQGILPGTQLMEEYISDLAQTQTAARRKFDTGMKDLVFASTNGLEVGRKETPYKDPNEMTAAERDASARGWASINLRREDQDGSGSNQIEGPSDVPLYYGNGGTAVTTGRGVVKIPMPKKNFVGATAIDLTTGRPSKLTRSSNDYEVVSVGNYPILNRDVEIKMTDGSKNILKKGSLVQDGYAKKYPDNVEEKPFIHVQEKIGSSVKDRLVDYDYMPKGLTKAQNEALSGFKPAAKTAQKEDRKAYAGYKIGQVDAGYKYIGGDPTKPESWVKVK